MKTEEIYRECEDDAAKWAKAFVERWPGIDEDVMHVWFANAIECAHDVRMRRAEND